MNLLAISSYGALGGGELSLAEFLVHRPADVRPVALLVEDGPLRGHLLRRNVPTWAAEGYDGRPSMIQLGRFTRSLLRLLAATRPDVVWATGLKAAYMAVPACRSTRVPLVWHKVDFSLDDVLTRPLATSVDGVISVSEAVADAMGPRLRRRKLLAVVGPPVRLPHGFRVLPNSQEPTIGTLATLTPIKGQRQLIEAAGMLSGEFPRLRVLLAGGASPDHPLYEAELLELARSVGLQQRLELPGFVEDVRETLGRLTVFVNATYRDERGFGREGLSGAMLEASWAGLPVVATRGGGTAEGVLDGLTGALVAPRDPGAIARAVAPYLREHGRAVQAGEAGARFARERFSPEVSAGRLFDALARAARRKA
jgi:glycosyltransferase involved in cell wall biosynthesis